VHFVAQKYQILSLKSAWCEALIDVGILAAERGTTEIFDVFFSEKLNENSSPSKLQEDVLPHT
jgi:hypothetical protein